MLYKVNARAIIQMDSETFPEGSLSSKWSCYDYQCNYDDTDDSDVGIKHEVMRADTLVFVSADNVQEAIEIAVDNAPRITTDEKIEKNIETRLWVNESIDIEIVDRNYFVKLIHDAIDQNDGLFVEDFFHEFTNIYIDYKENDIWLNSTGSELDRDDIKDQIELEFGIIGDDEIITMHDWVNEMSSAHIHHPKSKVAGISL